VLGKQQNLAANGWIFEGIYIAAGAFILPAFQ
jgi:hypothetical protein